MSKNVRRLAIVGVWLASTAVAGAQTIDLAAGTADPTWLGTQSGAKAGAWLDQGPVNAGDLRKDLVIGAPGGAGITGKVYVIFGGPPHTGDIPLTSADTTITGGAAGDLFGTSTATGNILTSNLLVPRNLAVGAPGALSSRGAVYVFTGGFHYGDLLSTGNAALTILGAPGDQLGTALATADLDNDSFRELIIGAPGNNRVYVIRGGASLSGTIDLNVTQAAVKFEAPGLGSVLAAGDVTGDGIYDLLVGDVTYNVVNVVTGRNTPGSIPTAFSMTFGGINPGDGLGTSIRLADFDADGYTDVVLGAPGVAGPANDRPGAGAAYLLYGGPSLTGRSMLNADVTFYGVDVNGRMGALLAAGDINRDIPNDVVLGAPGSRNGVGAVYVYYGRGRKSVGATRPDGTRVVDFADITPDRTLLGGFDGGTITSVQVYEVTGEGARDVIVGMSGTNANVGSVYFTISPRLATSSSAVTINGFQGVVSTPPALQVVNISTIQITWSASSNQPWLSVTRSGTADSTGAGQMALTANATGMTPGTYTATITVTSTSIHLIMSVPVQVTFVVTATQPVPVGPPAAGAAPGKLYQLLWRHSTQGWLAFWNMNGITMTGSSSLSINQMADTNWRIAGFADLDGDGQRDIVWQHDTQGWLAVWFMQGNRVTGTYFLSINQVDPNWQVRAVGDVNGDGRADLIFQHKTQGWLAVWYMNGTQVTGTNFLSINKMADPSWQIAAAGDLDGDGKADIIWQNKSAGWLGVWLMNGTQVTSTRVLSINKMADLNWTIVGSQDVNGDGKADILWEHKEGYLATWFMNAEQVTGTLWLNPNAVSDTAWRVAGPK